MLRSLCLLTSVLLAAAGPIAAVENDILAVADGLAAAGNYDDAITEYKRFVCFNEDDPRLVSVQSKIGMAYWKLGDRDRSIDCFLKAVENASSDQVRDDTRIRLAVLYLAAAEYSSAEAILLRVTTFSADEDSRRRAVFFLAICHLYQSRWREAQQELTAYFEGRDAAELARLNALLLSERWPRGKSRRLARWLSTLLPGLGQTYAGNFGHGFNALCVNLFVGLPTARSLAEGRLLEASTETPHFLRYYNGNRDNAGQLVDKYNDRLNRRYAEKVIEAIKTLVQ